MNTCELFGIPLALIDQEGLLEVVGDWITESGSRLPPAPRLISYVNTHCLNLAHQDEAYRGVLTSFDLVYADGLGVVWAAQWLRRARLHKLTGADWVGAFCRRAEQHGWRVYILAGAPGVAQQARIRLRRAYPALDIVGVGDGFFAHKDEEEVLQEIARLRPDILLVGMGVPKQEKWIAYHRDGLAVKICWGVGALFDYVAGIEPRAPRWMRNLGLEWLWRMGVDPGGKWKRYALGIPWFLARVWRRKYEQLSASLFREQKTTE